tara:strand:+ start:973 stop:1275 length:303 start_codon:yes stop_codon:yes gene_type:complete
MELLLSQWSEISDAFKEIFEGLGEITSTEETLEYSSIPPYVATGISITSDGYMVANMPLHNIDSKFERIMIDDSMHMIRLIGPNMDYTYRIPPQILEIRR